MDTLDLVSQTHTHTPAQGVVTPLVDVIVVGNSSVGTKVCAILPAMRPPLQRTILDIDLKVESGPGYVPPSLRMARVVLFPEGTV